MSDDDSSYTDEIKRVHEKYRDELLKRQLSNSEAYDKALLSLSSAGLALSLTVVQQLTPAPLQCSTGFIIASWIFFSVTILGVIASFLISNKAIAEQLKIAEDYYLNQNESARLRENCWAKINRGINIATGITFMLATLNVVIYAIINLAK